MENFYLTDEEIEALISEPKVMPQPASTVITKMKTKSNHKGVEKNSCEFPRDNNQDKWLIYVRQNLVNSLDFSCGLALIPESRQKPFMLLRYNGNSHEHSNKLEKGSPFKDFHIHRATEKYQQSSFSDDHYAEPTTRFAQFPDAYRCLIEDCNITDNEDQQGLF